MVWLCIFLGFSITEAGNEDEPTSVAMEVFIRTRNMTGEVVTFTATTQSSPRWSGVGYLTTGMTSASITIEGNYTECEAGFDSNGDAPSTYNVGYLGKATYVLTVHHELNSKSASVILVCNGWNFAGDKWLLYDFQCDSFYITEANEMTPINNVTNDSIVTHDTQTPALCNLQPTNPQSLAITNYYSHPKLTWTASAPAGGSKYKIYRNNDLVYTTGIGETEWYDQDVQIGGGLNDPFTYKVQGLSGDGSKTSSGYSNEETVNGIRYDKRQQTITNNQPQFATLLADIYPNPFNPETMIRYSVAEEQNVNITVFDAAGKQVKVLLDAVKPKGEYEIRFNASHLSSGVYYCKMTSGKHSETKKIILQK